MVAYAERYRALLPSLTCDESIVSQEVKDGVVRKQVTITGMLRQTRVANPKSALDLFTETHDFQRFDGVDRVEGKHYSFPYFLSGGFANGVVWMTRDRMQCFRYEDLPSADPHIARLKLIKRTEVEENPSCKEILAEADRTLIVDRESGHLLHSERTLAPELARQRKEAYFASTDYGPVQLGAETFWLPVKVTSRDAKDAGRFVATYQNFHRYGGTMTILPDTERSAPQ